MPRHLSRASATATAIAGMITVATYAFADVARFTPAIFVDQVFTDNVRADSNDRDADGITTVGLRLTGDYKSAYIQALVNVGAYYNEYWATNEFDDFNGEGQLVGRITILNDRLFVDGFARRQDVFLAPDITSGTGLSTGGSNTKQTEYAVGPLLTLDMFDLADLAVRATYAKVMYDEPIDGPLLVPIDDVTAKSISGRISTGERHSNYELIGTAEHLETEEGFELRNAVGHVLVHLSASITAIGRYGYERIADPTIALIRGPRWSVGGRYNMSKDSYVQLEYGHRFDETSWSGQASLLLTPRVVLNAQYTDRLTPAQLSNLPSFDNLFDDQGNLDLQTAPEPLQGLTFLNQIVRDKELIATTTYTRGLATFAFTGRHAERTTPALSTTEKVAAFDFAYSEQLSRSLTGTASVSYLDNYEPALGSDPSQQYRAEVGFAYLYNTDVSFTGALIWALSDQETGGDTQLSVLRFGVVQAF